MKKNLIRLTCLFLLLHPIMDLLTALTTRFEIGVISIGIILRGLFLLTMLIYFFFFNSSKYKRKLTKYLLIIFLFCIIYFLTKPELIFNKTFLIDEIIYMFKYMYFPVMLTALFSLYTEEDIDRKKIINIFVINLIIYALLIIIPFITNTSFNSYVKNKGIGVVGWFYSANEIGVVFAIVFPLLFLYINKKVKLSIVISLLIILFASFLIGTKISFFGCVLAIIMVLIYYFINNKKYTKSSFIVPVLLLIFVGLISSNLPVMKNINRRMNWYNKTNKIEEKVTSNSTSNSTKKSSTTNTTTKTNAKFLLSSRDKLFSRNYDIYKERPLKEKLFGIGFSNRNSINNKRIMKITEMDFFDILFRYGVVGLIIYLVPLIIAFVNIIKYLINNRFRLSIEQYLYLYSILVGIGSAFIAGHVLSAPPVSIYLVFLLVFSTSLFKEKNNYELDRDNIYILALHLGQGGIERAIVNTANALCKRKNVTIISFYKLDDDLYDIDSRVNIIYLYNGGPNREEFKEAIRSKNIFSIIKNGFKAINILLKKNYLMIKEIKKIKKGIIVSTTIKFSILLNYYGNDEVLKVVQEHKYHNNDIKYLSQMKYNYGNINYIMALTNKLANDYKKIFKDNNKIRIVVMPNMVGENIYETSSLNKKIVVSVNRLNKDKRVNEIIDIAYKLKDMNWEFRLIGGGEEYENLYSQINYLGLNDSVKLLGKLENKKVLYELCNASIYIMTSISEGFGICLAEACTAGLPIVCYEVENDLSDIVKNNENGYVIKNRNEQELIDRMRLLMKNIDKRKVFGKKSLIISKNYSIDEITNKWFDFIEKASL